MSCGAQTTWSLILVAALVAFAGGCGPSGPPTYPVAGTIVFSGQPIVKGTMTLIPEKSSERTASAQIVDGKYETELTEGVWTVNIQAVRESGPVIPALGEAPREQYIPAKYNRESTLKITVPSDQAEQNFTLEP